MSIPQTQVMTGLGYSNSEISAFTSAEAALALRYNRVERLPEMVDVFTMPDKIGCDLDDMRLVDGQWAKQFRTIDQGNFTLMDLSRISLVKDLHLRGIPDKYWRFVSDTYSQRLDLTRDEIDGFIKSSQGFVSRTKLIVNTSQSIRFTSRFNGGVSVVFSHDSEESLPVEKAIRRCITRGNTGKSAEIVRLIVAKDAEAKNLSRLLIRQAIGVILLDEEIENAYVYTSRVHYRLYKQLGVSPNKVLPIGERDVLIALKRKDLEMLYLHTQDVN
jgi:hypothetical protein